MSALVVFSVAPAWAVEVASLSIDAVIRWSDGAQLGLVGRDPVVEVARGDAARDQPPGDDRREDHPHQPEPQQGGPQPPPLDAQPFHRPHRIWPGLPDGTLDRRRRRSRAWSGSGSSGWARWGRRWPRTCARRGSSSPSGTGRPGRAAELVALGAREAATPAAVAARVGRGRVLRVRHARRRGRPVRRRRRGRTDSRAAASSSTARRSRPGATATSPRRLADAGVAFVDAPVSGGSEGAKNATLTIMVGGEPEAFERARPVLAGDGQDRHPLRAGRQRSGGEGRQPGDPRRDLPRRRGGDGPRAQGRASTRSPSPPRSTAARPAAGSSRTAAAG